MGIDLSLKGRCAVITGAGRGIGAAIAKKMAEAEAELFLIDKSPENLNSVKEDLTKIIDKIETAVCDIANPDDIAKTIADVKQRLGKIDILVNNAAVNYREKAFDVDLKNWQKVMDVNLRGTFIMAREAADYMIKDNVNGVIVNIGSELSFVGLPEGQVAYSTSKAGINQLGRVLAAEWGPKHIRVVTVIPGLTETELVSENLKKPGYRESFENVIPLGRIAKPEDIANAVVFMASDMASFITGETLLVDGGYTNARE